MFELDGLTFEMDGLVSFDGWNVFHTAELPLKVRVTNQQWIAARLLLRSDTIPVAGKATVEVEITQPEERLGFSRWLTFIKQ